MQEGTRRAAATSARALLAAALAGCAGAALAGCAATPSPMQREAEFGSAREVTDAEASFRATLSIPFELGSDADGIQEIRIPVADSVPIQCFVSPAEGELGATAVRLTRLIFQKLEANANAISEQRLVSLESGTVGDTAYQAVQTSFRLDSENGTGIGLMKAAAANKHGRGIVCGHWGTGYAETFERVFAELVGSFQVPVVSPEPSYKEIVRVRVGDLAVGVVTTTFTPDAEGYIQGIAESSTLIPTSPGELAASYSRSTDWIRPGGELINAYVTESDLDEEHTDLALSWEEDAWHVAGAFRGEEIDLDLEHAGLIDSMLTDLLVARYVLEPHGDQSSVTLRRWIPDNDPTRVIETVFALDPADPRRLTMKVGEFEFRALRDADGLPERGTMQVGRVQLTVERIYRRGEL